MRTGDFEYQLPSELIAQTPIEPRDHSRLMVLDRLTGAIAHRRFDDITDYLRVGDLLICNESRVIPARLLARRADTGGRLEILLLKEIAEGTWETLVKPGKRARPGTRLILGPRVEGGGWRGLPLPATLNPQPSTLVTAVVLARTEAGGRVIRFSDPSALDELGAMPLPPYIKAPLLCSERYQTVYSRPKGSAAAPTAGLHFTPELLDRLKIMGVQLGFVTLHVGLDTFRPVEEDDAEAHVIHSEFCELGQEVADLINRARVENRRVIAVGTTTVRALESAARVEGGWWRVESGNRPLNPPPS
ncbi:MAG: tRNA preQ1(34) S-adenosylmethionine ribosyltransferase-isomerase QueA, partial [Dehalococcoidia bacterium]|nr:tRNA preQ1(34) S-adenosylmethionine ribosyltransferase-isomerase QueA [Dehalococcoidia bacterium]